MFYFKPDTILQKNCEIELIKIAEIKKFFNYCSFSKENNYGYFKIIFLKKN